VAALHRAGIVHRDIKPDNVILSPDGSPTLIDFGVARLPGMDEDGAFLEDGVPGTASYMAPELFDGRPGDERSDQFALGVTLFRAFTGRYPYGEIEPFSHPRFTRPQNLSAYRPDLPAWLGYALERCLAPSPDQRFADVLELAQELESGPGAVPLSRRPRPLYQRDPVRFWQVISFLLAAGWLASLGLAGKAHRVPPTPFVHQGQSP
jgi:serine/threonine protein kinase